MSEQVQRITINKPDDFHVHFRRGDMLSTVVPYTAQHFGRAMVMPNTSPQPILTGEDAAGYYAEIMDVVNNHGLAGKFMPLMTIQITDETTPEIIREAKKREYVIAGKVYPKGVTTNSQNGVMEISKLYPVFNAMQDADMVLSLHGEDPLAFCLDRERRFLDTLRKIATDFPYLRIVLEHISTKESVQAIFDLPRTVAATITAHHLKMTLQDVLAHVGPDGSEGINPHNYCKPLLQKEEDRAALCHAATSDSPKFFFGSDSAPHWRSRKENSCGCAGVFSAPVALAVLAEFYAPDESGLYDPTPFRNFMEANGEHFYKLQRFDFGKVTLVKKPWTVDKKIFGPKGEVLVPFLAGKELDWDVEH